MFWVSGAVFGVILKVGSVLFRCGHMEKTKKQYKKLYIENLGCAKNQVDAEVIAYNLKQEGYELCLDAEDADLVVVNTCAFIEDAKKESVDVFFSLRRKYPEKKMIISGCLAQRYANALADELQEVDAIFGNRDLSKIVPLVRELEAAREGGKGLLSTPGAGTEREDGESRGAETESSTEKEVVQESVEGLRAVPEASTEREGGENRGGTPEGIEGLVSARSGGENNIACRPLCIVPEYPSPADERDTRDSLLGYPGSAYLKISEGCNHRCSYCAIPVIRGPLRSRPIDAVLEEAARLVKTGVREINLIAQDLAAYGLDWGGESRFIELLDRICAIEGDFRVRMLYIHPDAMTDGIIDAVKRNPKILHYFDIPFQSGSEGILRSMGRTGSREKYTALISHIRAEIPDAVIRTTIMLGYPGDDAESFRETKRFVEDCKFDWMGSFVYSREEDTKAFGMTTQEAHDALAKKAKRWKRELERLQESITRERLEEFVGRDCDVLVEEKVEGEDLAIGRIYAQAPEVDGLTVVMGRGMESGQVYRCRIHGVNGVDLDAIRL